MAEPRKPAFPDPPDDEDIIQRRTFRDYYIILRERLWIALPLALLVSISLGYMKARATPMYSASATMEFIKPDTVVTTTGVVDASVRSDSDLFTYLEKLNNSSDLRERVLESITPDEAKFLLKPALKGLKPGDPPPALNGGMLGSISCSQKGKSYIIQLTVNHTDPD